jgi:hypothetical protein
MNKIAGGLCALLVSLACLVWAPAGTRAADEELLPPEVLSGAEHLLKLAGPSNEAHFQPEYIAKLMEFVIRDKKTGEVFSAGSAKGFSSSYHDANVGASLIDLLKYTYNPAIPWFLTCPSSLRSSSWKQTEKPWSKFPRLWELLGSGDSPVVIRGLETVENTPDLFTGTYCRYDLHRTLILLPGGPRRTVISISKQADVSDVGRKGFIVGKDENWTYFYSGVPGLNVTGLGWVKPYVYDSAGISIFTERGYDSPSVRMANLQWLRAGWANINLVRSDHIHRGMLRYARALKEILESPRLPAAKTLEEDCIKIACLSDDALRDKLNSYRRLLAGRGARPNGGEYKDLPDAFWKESYWEGLNREQMQSLLVLEALKGYLGKTPAEWGGSAFLTSAKPTHPGG